MEIAQRARSFPILFSTLVIGLSPLIPVPLVDDIITAALCRWRVKYFATRAGLILSKEEIKILADEQQIGCLAGAAKRTFGFVLREIWENLVPLWEAGRAIDLLSRTYYYGVLLDFAFYDGLYKAGNVAEVERLRKNIFEIRNGANLRQLKALFKASGKGTRDLSVCFVQDVSERYFKSILVTVKKRWRYLLKQQDQYIEQADQATENLDEAAASWGEKYKRLFDELSRTIAEIPDKEIEGLCLALRAKMNQSALPQTSQR